MKELLGYANVVGVVGACSNNEGYVVEGRVKMQG
jgi:hypothetical protein